MGDHVTSADGTRIAWSSAGAGAPLVLVHGTTSDRTIWMMVLAALAARSRVVTYDRRGRGESGDAPAYALEREAEDLAAVVAAVGEPVRLLGHSYGALVSLAALPLLAARVERLVLYEPPYAVPVRPDDLARLNAQLAAGDREGILTTFLL